MKRTLIAAILLTYALPAGRLFSQAADKPKMSENEIRVPAVDFQNRNNLPVNNQFQQTQVTLGQNLARNVVAKQTAEEGPIRVERYFDPATPGLGADIVSLSANSTFGHIFSLQRILAGYLMESFQYPEADARTLAMFLLYYNARQRGNIAGLKDKYSADVMTHVNADSAGIDRSYQNWPGKTQILLPLTKNIVRPGKTDISDNDVRKETGKITPEEKKQFDDLQKKRREDDDKRLDKKEEQVKQDEKKVQEEKKDVQKQITENKVVQQETQKKLEDLRKDPEKNKDEIKKQEQKQTELVKKEEQLKKQEQVVAKKEENVQQQKQDVQQQKQDNTQKKEETANLIKDQKPSTDKPQTTEQTKVQELQKENQALKDKEKAKDQKSENVVGEKILFLRILKYLQGGHYANELWTIDTEKDDALFRGPFTNICGKEFQVIPGQGVLVVGYSGSAHGDQEHHLYLLDTQKLDVRAESKESVFWRTPMIQKDGKIYAFEEKDNATYLVRFNADLTLEARSSDPISPNTDVTFFKEKIYITGKGSGSATDGVTTIRVFNRADLKMLKTIEPQSRVAGP